MSKPICNDADAVVISSVVVNSLPGRAAEVREGLQALPGVDIHAVSADGRMVITLECSSASVAVETFDAVRQTDGVLSAVLVYTQTEPDPYQEICDEADAT